MSSSTLVSLVVVGAVFLGCHDQCDPGYTLENYLCVAIPDDTASGGAAGSDDAGGGEPGTGPASCEPSTFGADCTSSADCTCDSSFCAAYPGDVGFCTRTGCLEDPSVCPTGYGCFDISALQPGQPSICTPP